MSEVQSDNTNTNSAEEVNVSNSMENVGVISTDNEESENEGNTSHQELGENEVDGIVYWHVADSESEFEDSDVEDDDYIRGAFTENSTSEATESSNDFLNDDDDDDINVTDV